MKQINISTKKYPDTFALVSDTDFEYFNQWKWYKMSNGYCGRAVIVKRKMKILLMHRIIMKTVKGMEVEHRDNNKLNNQRENLLNVTPTHNKTLRRKLSTNTSGYQGVTFAQNAWRAGISFKEKFRNLGYFKTKEEAALAYNRAAKKYFGEFAYQNKIGGLL